MSSPAAAAESPPSRPRQTKRQPHASRTPAASSPFDFRTVTCVTWSASGRTMGVGTPDGFLVFSTEPLIATLSGSSAVPPPPLRPSVGVDDAGAGGILREVCRCVVYGGVGLLSLHRQCSIAALAGVQRRTAAARVQLVDMGQTPPSTFFTTTTSAAQPRRPTPPHAGRPWPPEEDAAVSEWYEKWRSSACGSAVAPAPAIAAPLAFAACPATVAALHFNPHVVVAATSGDPNVAGSHLLYVFDHRMRPLCTLPVHPPSSNAYLTDMIAIAAAFTASNGAGMMVQRLRVLLPGEKKGEVRLLTLKKSVLTATAHDSAAANGSGNGGSATAAALHSIGDTHHRLVDRVLHQAPLRAVAITEDGRSGVTMSTQGMRLRLLDFVGDDIITERLSLDRGRLPAVADSVSLAIVPVPQPGANTRSATAAWERHERCSSDSGVVAAACAELPNRQYQLLTEALHDIVVCLTSSGTLHVFGCGQQQVLFYHSDKTLLPRVGYPFSFSLCLPSQLVKESGVALFVTRSDIESSATRLLPRREHRLAQEATKAGAGVEAARPPPLAPPPGDFFAFQLRYPASLATRGAGDDSVLGGESPHSTLFVTCPFAV